MRSEPEVRGYDERAGATRSLDADRGGWGDDTAGRADATAAEVPTDADLVVRKPHPTDRRATIVELTPGGFEAADALIAPRIVAMGSLFDVLDDGECAVFTRVLHRLRDAMADGSAPSSPADEVAGRAGTPAPQV